MVRSLVLDISELTASTVRNFICGLRGPARDEAIGLLCDFQERVWKYEAGNVTGSLPQLLGLRPLKGVSHYFEKRGRTVRIYVKYAPGGKLTIVNGVL